MRALTSVLTRASLARALRTASACLALAGSVLLTAPGWQAEAASVAPSRAAATAATAATAAPGLQPGCHYAYQPPDSWVVICDSGGGLPGGPGHGGGGKVTCTLVPLTPAQISYLRLPAAPKGEEWAAITCPGTDPFDGVTLEYTDGAPAVTPQELLQIAEGELTVPPLKPGTAPPVGADALVGLPELFWIPAGEWDLASKQATRTVAAGPVWATVTATPEQISFDPGGGLAGPGCRGPGAAYSAARIAGQGLTCSYTYDESSALQPGGAYSAAVVVTWRVTWVGSGGVGGTLNAALQVPWPLTLRVAEGQALVTGR